MVYATYPLISDYQHFPDRSPFVRDYQQLLESPPPPLSAIVTILQTPPSPLRLLTFKLVNCELHCPFLYKIFQGTGTRYACRSMLSGLVFANMCHFFEDPVQLACDKSFSSSLAYTAAKSLYCKRHNIKYFALNI